MECISIGNGKLVAWIQHRQHPGETMAEFFAEGFLHRLLGVGADGELDDATKRVLEQYRLYIVPCMCPDGAVRGHLRTNSVGANLNREWCHVDNHEGYEEGYAAPTLERSPEVYAVLNKMDETGVDFFLDVHGDEELPYVFFSGAEMTPVWGERIKRLHGYFINRFQVANSDVQKEIGYPPPESESAALKYMNVATNQVSCRFNCLGLTLEMPYKDCETNPDPDKGFNPARAIKLGTNLVEALDDVHSYLRAEGEFWGEFSEEDKYVEPTDTFKEEGFIMLHKRLYSDVRPHVT
jgi:murein tripeptide amidase MpaA